MDIQAVEQYLLSHQKYFPSEKLSFMREQLALLTEQQASDLYSIELNDPLVVLIMSIFLGAFGIDRFMLRDITKGILKLITCGGCGIWTFIDWILIYDISKQYNFEKLMNFISGKYF